ncbi:hypothetical protein [Escherichia coli]|uniref:hypothetical protein n=1 Tax=Escherichia coli TaxID=562 RepID=UPI0031B59A23
MNTYEKIYQKLKSDNNAPVIKGEASSSGDLSIEELAEKYNIDKEALKRAISLSKSLRQGEV